MVPKQSGAAMGIPNGIITWEIDTKTTGKSQGEGGSGKSQPKYDLMNWEIPIENGT
jgi:hypothetical protein